MNTVDFKKPIMLSASIRHSKAFTIVELLIVIAIIGILATVAVVGFSGYQADARDAQRSSKTTVIAEALEKYYDLNGEYPSCSAVTANATTVAASTLVGINTESLTAPKAAASETNSIECTDLTGAAGEGDYYAYIGDSSTACATGVACLQFTLKYYDESTNSVVSINSRRHTEIATSGTPTVTASPTGFSTATASWTAVPNAMNYTLQQATNSGFTANLIETTHNGASSNITSLAYNTTYYYRVKANTASSVGTWSNVDTAATWILTTPTLTATANSLTQVTADWSDISHAAGYNFEYSTSSTFASGVVASSTTASTKTITGLAAGTTYYFRVQATNGSYSGSWATKSVVTPQLATPVATATTNSFSQITVDWSDITYATSYTINYSAASDFSASSTTTSTTSTKAIEGLYGGKTYYFRVQAVASADTSGWSATRSATTTAANPSGAPTISASMASASVARGTVGSAGSCVPGMNMTYLVRYHSTNVAADGSWSGWYGGTTLDITALQGSKYTYQSAARCEGSDAASGYNFSGTANVIRPISTPAAPGWAITTEWAAGYNYNMYYSWSCPSGTSIGSNGVSSNSGGASQATPWVDWWYVAWNNGQVESWHTYNAAYTCQTAYSSADSPVTSTQIHAYCDPSRRNSSARPSCDKDNGGGPPYNGHGNY